MCELSTKSVNNSINQLLSSLFITAQLLSEKDFNGRIASLIEQTRSTAPITVTRLLYLIRRINQANAVISNYGTNFEYIYDWYGMKESYYAPTQAVIYDDGCSCGLNSNCTTQASFVELNSSRNIPIKGLKMGCMPSESFRASTLECFYDQTCLDLIQRYTNSTNRMIPLSQRANQSVLNTSIAALVDNLFVEQWLTTKNYSSYFEQCAPLLCSYSYTQSFSLLYTITVLLGLQGGLAIVLQWICPRLIQIIANIYERRKKRINIVQPANTVGMPPAEIDNPNVRNTTADLELVPTNAIPRYFSTMLISEFITSVFRKHFFAPSRSCFKFIIICLVIALMITVLIVFSIYVYRLYNNKVIPTGILFFSIIYVYLKISVFVPLDEVDCVSTFNMKNNIMK